MRPYFSEFFGNPSSILIEEGAEPRKAMDEARLKVSRLINAETDEVIFTGSATESNNLAIKVSPWRTGIEGTGFFFPISSIIRSCTRRIP